MTDTPSTTPAGDAGDALPSSPLAQAEDDKARRDLGGEIGTLMRADADLAAQPWAPVRPGNVVLMYLPARGDIPAYGQTFLAIKGETDISGHAILREVSRTLAGDEDDFVEPLTPFYDLWFEAGPEVLTVIRGGAVVYGCPVRPGRRIRVADEALFKDLDQLGQAIRDALGDGA